MSSSKSDALWQDELKKRRTLAQIYGAPGSAFIWANSALVVRMILSYANGEKISYHPRNTPLVIGGLMLIGPIFSGLMYDQDIAIDKLKAQRLARRIAHSPEKAEQEELKYAAYPFSKIPWRQLLKPGAKTLAERLQKPDTEDDEFNRLFYRKYMARSAKRLTIGGIQFGTITVVAPFILNKILARQSGEESTYRHPNTTVAIAALLAVGYTAQYFMARSITEIGLLNDNYEAREIAKTKGRLHEGVSNMSALFTGEKVKKDNPFIAYDRKWLKENTKIHAEMFFLNGLVRTFFYGVISTIVDMVTKKSNGETVKYNPVKSTATLTGAMLFGGVASYFANLFKAKIKKNEDDRQAIRITGHRPDADGNMPDMETSSHSMGQKKANIEDKKELGMQKKEKIDILNDNSFEPPENFKAYDDAWQKKSQMLSFWEGLFAAIAAPLFFSFFAKIGADCVDRAGDPEKKISLRKYFSPLVLGLAAVGAGFSFLSNKKHAELTRIEDNRLAHRIRKSDMLMQQEAEPDTIKKTNNASSMRIEEKWVHRMTPNKSQRTLVL